MMTSAPARLIPGPAQTDLSALRFNQSPPLGDGLIVAPPGLHGQMLAALDLGLSAPAGTGPERDAG